MKKLAVLMLAVLVLFQMLVSVSAVWERGGFASKADASVEDTGPTKPETPEDPEDPERPTEPETPEDPEKPTEPETPEDPEEPTEPEEPSIRADELHAPYLQGSADGGFYPNKALSRAEMAKLIDTLGDYAPANACFSDVEPGMWYAAPINALAAAGILNGYTDGSFRPSKSVNRAEFVTVLANLSGETATQETSFPDVPEDFWGKAAISLAQEKGWVNGYSDGSFRPDRTVCRAEAVVMLNRFLGRTPDQEAIDRGEGLRFFPDVTSDSWFYYHVMEATTGHTAHYETPDSEERWLAPYSEAIALKDGFYCFDKRLFVVQDGSFVRTAGAGSSKGVDYVCQGSSGVCTVRVEVLPLYSGKLTLLSGGIPIFPVNEYPEGFYLKAGQLYVARNGMILHEKTSGTIDGVSYTCTGSSGVCTTPDWTKLNLPQCSLSVFSSHLTAEAEQSGTAKLTLAQALRAAVKVYEAYFRVEYPLTDGTDAQYVELALHYNILDQARSGYSESVSRGELLNFLWRALRGRELEAINEVEYIPDVAADNEAYPAVLALYRAGIFGGVDDARNAALSATVDKTELAALLKRLELRASRLRFTLRRKVMEKIQYGTSGSGTYPLEAYQFGDGKNVVVLTFALHGWEDNFDRDGKELIYLADEVRSWLEQNYDLLTRGDWRVYVLRCINPDGVYLGSTCNGKGRCTTTRLDANGKLLTDKGIDMNRCFPYNYKQFTDARNFNGDAPLQCKEAKALADFVQKVKGSGYNICVDTHGWLGQVITSSGKGTLANVFLKQFPDSYYSYLGKGYGYFTSWTGFSLGYDSCLLELPQGITSHESFLSNGCVWRFENALKELLQTYKGADAKQALTVEEMNRIETFDD